MLPVQRGTAAGGSCRLPAQAEGPTFIEKASQINQELVNVYLRAMQFGMYHMHVYRLCCSHYYIRHKSIDGAVCPKSAENCYLIWLSSDNLKRVQIHFSTPLLPSKTLKDKGENKTVLTLGKVERLRLREQYNKNEPNCSLTTNRKIAKPYKTLQHPDSETKLRQNGDSARPVYRNYIRHLKP